MEKEKVIKLLDQWYTHDIHTERVADEILNLFALPDVSRCECGKNADIHICDNCYSNVIDKAEHGI